MLTIEKPALESLAALLLERAGLRIAPDGFHGLRLALKERMPALGISDAEDYVRRLRERQGEHELRALLPLVTVTHTEFFRDPRQFKALEQRVLPEALARARRQGRKVSIWSAGCATGEEPYSLAMVMADLGASRDEVDLWATDLNQSAVESARIGRYPLRRMGPVGKERMKKYFRPTDDGYQVLEEVRQRVQFDGVNLAAPVFSRVHDAMFDVILCRNVIIYFDLPTIRRLMDRFYAALRPGAFLILGYSESLFRVYDRFEMVEVEGAFLYRRPRLDALPSMPKRGIVQDEPASNRPSPARPAITGEYPIVTPARAAARTTGEIPAVTMPPPDRTSLPRATPPAAMPAVPSPTRSTSGATPLPRVTGEFPIVVPAHVAGSPPASPTPTATRRAPTERLNDAARMVQEGRFEQAVAALVAMKADEPDDITSLLTLGNVYSVMGRADEARRAFQEVASREPLCVEVRIYAAMAAMQVREFATARSELSKALFLEPTLALAHYLSAQVTESLGDHEAARRSYRNAISQLRHPQRPLAGYYPDLPDSPELISRAARYALAALEEAPTSAR